MAQIKLLYMATGGYHKNAQNTDELLIGKVTLAGVGGVSLDAGGASVTGLPTPVNATDAASKSYVDQAVSGLTVKTPVRVATVGGNITVASAAPTTLDGVTLTAGDRILVKDQTTASQNGIYVVQTLGTGANGVWVRASDAASSADVGAGMYVYVNEGTQNADTAYVLTTDNPITLNTTALTFTLFSGLGQVNAGSGLTKTGNTLNVGAGNGITVNADNIQIDLDASPGLTLSASGLKVDPDSTRGINVDAAGVYLGLNATNPGLAFAGTYVDVKYDGARAITAGASGIGINLETTNPGLAIVSNKLNTKLDGARAITATASGLGINLESSSPSLQISSNQIGVKFDAAGGLQKTASGTGIKLNGATLGLGASGLSVLGVPSLFTIGGVAVSANVTADNLSELTSGDSTALHNHDNVTFPASTLGGTAIACGAPVYVSSSGTVGAADYSSDSTAAVVGICNQVSGPVSSTTVQTSGVVQIAGATFTPATEMYLGATGALVTWAAIPSGKRVVRCGIALSATSLLVAIMDYGEKP